MTAAGGSGGGRRQLVSLLVLLALLVGSAVVLVGTRGGGGGKTAAAGAGEIFLEPAAAPGPSAFTPSVAGPVVVPRPVIFPNTTKPATGQTVVLGATGTEPGLYGGTRDDARCDAAQMAGYLEQNPDKAKAFAAVQGITVADVRSFLLGLTPVQLRVDTRVTNHGFANGVATPRQAVLQAGTAVLVDATGVPRAKCACGNPLAPPAPVPTTPTYTGEPWAGFDAAQVVVAQPGPPVDGFVLADPTTGEPFVRPVGTSGTADVDAPVGTDVSDPLRGAAPVTPSTTTTTGPPVTGSASYHGTVSLPPAVQSSFSSGDTRVEPTDSRIDLALDGKGGATGSFSITVRVSETGGCTYLSRIEGDLTGTIASGALTGTWSGGFAESVQSGDCSGVSLTNAKAAGTWTGRADASTATGSIVVEGAELLSFEAGG